MTPKPLLFVSIVSALGLCGCASLQKTAIFVTKTSISVVDADTTPPGVSIAYDRVEGYIAPRFDDGTVFPVASVLETGGSGFSRTIRQVFATGDAARIVTGRDSAATAGSTAPDIGVSPSPTVAASAPTTAAPTDNKVMFFGTGTVVGLKIGFLEGSALPNSFVLGYKRKEVAVIPVEKGREPSVLATFTNGVGVTAPEGSGRASTNFDVEQYFATGTAASNLAAKPEIRQRFQQTAVKALGDIEKFRLEEARQGRLALDTLNCFVKVEDDKLDMVWNNAEALGIFADYGTVDSIRKHQESREQRDIYIQDMALLNPDSVEYTQLLVLHQKTVCKLSKSTH